MASKAITKNDLKDILDRVLEPGIVTETPSTVSAWITLNSGWTITAWDIIRCGHVWNIRFVGVYNAAWANNTQLTMGVLKEGYRPKIEVSFNSILTNGVISPNGTVYVRNVCGGQIAANAITTFCLSFIK